MPALPVMVEYLTSTQSICRDCRKAISAQILVEEKEVWLQKRCPEHGLQRARIYGDAEAYLKLGRFHRKASVPLSFAMAAQGCPDSCGLCPEHEQHVCLPIIEITDHCNWNCPICLVNNPGSYHRTREEVSRILDGLIRSEGKIDVLNLSGGEPTLNPHFREIIEECVSRKEILRVSVSTNGSVLARNKELLQFLSAHRVIVSLQFDGLNDEVYLALRGLPALQEKLHLIDLCGENKVSMSLTATVAGGINEREVKGVADLLFRHEHVLSA
ncbi:MAG TPA: radical SAM protein, partial [Clostridia bacterium]|nr:radical SAM protein [Clostridia bacterium]